MRVLIAEEDPSLRRALERIVDREPGIETVTVIGSSAQGEMVLALTRDLRPDVVLLPLHQPLEGMVEVARALQTEFPTLSVIGIVKNVALVVTPDAASAFSSVISTQRLDLLTDALYECLARARTRINAVAA